jgi:hypothetical protein
VAAISTARKISIVARVAARQAGRQRTLAALAQAGRVTLNSSRRALHLLWLEVTGFFFLSLAAIGGFALVREYPKYEAGKVSGLRLLAAGCFLLLFAYFGVSSFWRARKKP